MISGIVRVVRPHLCHLLAVAGVWVLAVPASLASQSQDATLTGTVSDASSNEPIGGARVFVPGTVMSATTRLDGSYRLRLTPGTREIRVAHRVWSGPRHC